MDFQANSSAKMRELLRGTVEMLRNNSPQDYLTKYVKGKAEIEAANSRGFIVVLDYEDLGSFGYMEPDGGNLVTTHKPAYDRITCNYQYIQVGSELTNETLSNSKHGRPVGADAKAAMIEKASQKMLDMEEFYFCQGDGNQTFARITGANAAAVIPVAGTADGFGAYFLKKGAVIRIYDSTLVTLKGTRTITAKTSNTAITVDTTLAVINGDLILPEGDATTPTTTGIKGLPYIMLATGAYFDKNKTNTPALKPIVDSASAALSRTKIENLDQRHRIRNGRRMDVGIVTSPTQHSAYFSLFTALTPTANWNGNKRPAGDLGLDSWDYTWFGKPIREFKCVPATAWYHLTFSSLCRVEMGDIGKMITPAGDYVQKVDATLGYLNSQQRWDDAYLEFFSPNPALNAGLTALTFTNMPLLVEDTWV